MNRRPRGFILYDEALSLLLMLPPEQAGKVIQAAGKCFLNDESPTQLDLAEQMAFSMIRNGIENSKAKYEEQCERNKRGAAHRRKDKDPTDNKSSRLDTTCGKSSQVVPNVTEHKHNHNITESERNVTEYQGSLSFSPPSLDEVRAFCEEEGLMIDSYRFYQHYSEKEWRLSGGDPVKDWRETARSWAKKDRRPERAAEDWMRPQQERKTFTELVSEAMERGEMTE